MSKKPIREASPAPIQSKRQRRRLRSVTSIMTAARKAGLDIRGVKIGEDGGIDIQFGRPAADGEPEDLAKLV